MDFMRSIIEIRQQLERRWCLHIKPTWLLVRGCVASIIERLMCSLMSHGRRILLGRILVLAPSKNELKLVETSCNTPLKWRRHGMDEAKIQNN